MKFKPKYSGKESTEFWRKINRIPEQHARHIAYLMGVVLQDLEESILQKINSFHFEQENPDGK